MSNVLRSSASRMAAHFARVALGQQPEGAQPAVAELQLHAHRVARVGARAWRLQQAVGLDVVGQGLDVTVVAAELVGVVVDAPQLDGAPALGLRRRGDTPYVRGNVFRRVQGAPGQR